MRREIPEAHLVAAMVAGVLVSFVLAAFSIKYFVDQVIVGVVLNVLVTGLTGFLFSQVLAPNAATLNQPPRFDRINVSGNSRDPAPPPRITASTFGFFSAIALEPSLSVARKAR